jgi:ABC-type amino acid transport substrate-binding protein
VVLGGIARWYLSSAGLEYDLDKRLLSLTVPSPHDDVIVFSSRESVPKRVLSEGSTLERIQADKVIRVGYHADHLPYSFFNQQQELVGFDVELLNRLAERLDTRLEFVPYEYNSVVAQLNAGEIDLAIGGLIITPERLIQVGFTQPYETATLAVVTLDHRRREFSTLDGVRKRTDLRLAVVQEDLAAARRRLPNTEIVVLDSYSSFFGSARDQLDGLIIPAEEGAAWTVLYPGYAVTVPVPVTRRPVGIAFRLGDAEWRNFLDSWLEFERLDGSLESLKTYWVEGGGTTQHPRRWCVLRDVLHWIP